MDYVVGCGVGRTNYPPHAMSLHGVLICAIAAEQLTLLNDTLMRQILPVEYVNHVRYKKEMHPNEYDTFSRNLQRFIQRFNLETNWVTNEILAAESQKNQTTLIDKFVKVACHCLDLNNFYSLFAVMGGVTTSKVQKLPAWKALSKKTKKVVAKMEETILNPTGNMRGYRLVRWFLVTLKPVRHRLEPSQQPGFVTSMRTHSTGGTT
eukprot:m.266734 g.266734  ORF g.266734 m.266734 type:complete len:207 (-) comp15632_c1_seq7:231-851(-)